MKHPSVISIDLGSAYTKVGIRRGWDAATSVVRGLPIAPADEESYCIPSVVALVERRRTRRWLVGVDAASQLPGDGVRVFRNWKAALFNGTASKAIGNAAAVDARREATQVAVEFLRQIRERLLERVSRDIDQVPVRVAIPQLDGDDGSEHLIANIVQEAGWVRASCRPTVYEPESNAIGLLSRGRNRTWVPPQRSHRPPSVRSLLMQRMLEPGLSTAFRNMSAHYAVLVTDIGAFTTDFGFVDIDTSLWNDDWNRPRIVQQSVKLGIRQLDEQVLNRLKPAIRRYLEEQPATEWERRKRELYAGRPQQIVIGGKTVTIGDGAENEAIQHEIQCFAKQVAEARRTFCVANKLSTVHEEAVTGGGSAVRALRETLVVAISDAKRRVHDLWDPQEPEKATAAGAGRMTPREQELRRKDNLTLIRSGSAIGGASVFFE